MFAYFAADSTGSVVLWPITIKMLAKLLVACQTEQEKKQ